ncbi:unnamed protein product [Amoebophrya sp. A25]|nr:unnamed protein product [Amoebophrya sp. A25]|eukprot:GSA25T00019813001.1
MRYRHVLPGSKIDVNIYEGKNLQHSLFLGAWRLSSSRCGYEDRRATVFFTRHDLYNLVATTSHRQHSHLPNDRPPAINKWEYLRHLHRIVAQPFVAPQVT